MSADIINLRQARKQKQRKDKQKSAEDNRRRFGRSKAEREAARRRREELESHVDAHLLQKPSHPGSDGSSGDGSS